MAMSLQERLRLEREAAAKWIRARDAEMRRAAGELEARGRKVYADTIRTGEKVLARTEAELRELGRAATRQRAAPTSKRPAHPPVAQGAAAQGKHRAVPHQTSVGEKARAALSGAVDEFSFGTADYVSAGLGTVMSGNGADLSERFKAELAEQRAQDSYDAEHYGFERGAGQAAGLVASIVATGGAGGVAKAGLKVAAPRVIAGLERATRAATATRRTAPMAAKGLMPMAVVGGGASGVVGQGVSDLFAGRISGPSDYLASAVGGAAGGLTARLQGNSGRITGFVDRALRSPMVAGAVDGVVATGAKAILSDRDLEALDLARGARGGAVGARIGDAMGKYGANALDRGAKEALGEHLTIIKAVAGGDGNPLGGKPIPDFAQRLPGVTPRGNTPGGPGPQRWLALPRGRWTRPDFITNQAKAFESKFGAYARLTAPQRIAMELFDEDQYQVAHWLPSDMGRAGAVLVAAPTSHLRGDPEP